MKVPWWFFAVVGFQAVPMLIALRARQSPARLWIATWLALLLAADLVAGYLGMVRHQNNRWVSYVFTPLQAFSILWALMCWHREPVVRNTIRNSIVILILAVLGLSAFENVRNFSRYTEPVVSVVAMLVAIYTLASRSADAVEPLTRTDWFWTCVGVVIVYGATAALTPLAAFFINQPELIHRAYLVRVPVHALGLAAITIGMLCPISPSYSGISSPSPLSA